MNVDNTFAQQCFETRLDGQHLHIVMRGVSKRCSELSIDWYLYALNGLKGPFQSIEIDLLNQPMVNSAFIAGALELHNKYLANDVTKIRLLHVDERTVGLMNIMNLMSFFDIVPLSDS